MPGLNRQDAKHAKEEGGSGECLELSWGDGIDQIEDLICCLLSRTRAHLPASGLPHRHSTKSFSPTPFLMCSLYVTETQSAALTATPASPPALPPHIPLRISIPGGFHLAGGLSQKLAFFWACGIFFPLGLDSRSALVYATS